MEIVHDVTGHYEYNTPFEDVSIHMLRWIAFFWFSGGRSAIKYCLLPPTFVRANSRVKLIIFSTDWMN
jgi:hypothetical protein